MTNNLTDTIASSIDIVGILAMTPFGAFILAMGALLYTCRKGI